MEDVTTFLSLTTGVFPIACKTESRIGLLYAMVFSHASPQVTLLELDAARSTLARAASSQSRCVGLRI
jgi:hypothetical protein